MSKKTSKLPTACGPILTIRGDASREGGTGHIMRSLALAQEWIKRGGHCHYLCAPLPEALESRLKNEGCEITILNSEPGSTADAHETSAFVETHKSHWLHLDGYHLAQQYQKSLTLPERTRLAVMSDFGDDDFLSPDRVIHANLQQTASYGEKIAAKNFLTGPNFILLRQELIRKSAPLPPPARAEKLLISMGGGDHLEAAHVILEHLDLASLSCRVILGPAYPADGTLRKFSHPSVQFIQSPESLAPHYEWADSAITTPSTTALEMIHHGLVIGLITVADNQTDILAAALKHSAGLALADLRNNREIDTSSLDCLINDSDERLKLSASASRLIDGHGAGQVCDSLGLPDIHLRSAELPDAERLFLWANEPTTRAASFQSDPIPWESHLAWFTASLSNSARTIWIIQTSQEIPLGQCRFDEESLHEFVISISLSPETRGKGLAALVITRACSKFIATHPEARITAWIKNSNRASLRAFERAGFHIADGDHPADRSMMRL
ncbi:MAG: bifunctional UDP-2,4-diacetamido-2,4,6-trideoxy-beta-L-altropyranose hydrolase/GNAT family N-acetyltransferase [Akkermansiaceae bacterium]